MEINKKRLEELLIFAQYNFDQENIEYQNMIKNYMPNIVINKKTKDLLLWEDLLEVVRLYIQAIDLDIITLEEVAASTNEIKEEDMVNSPKHYTNGQYEVIDVIKDWLTPEEFRGYVKGNTIKYVSRERYKNGDEDLFKTIFYLNYLMNGKKSDGRKDK